MPQTKHSLASSGLFEHHRFCECLEIVIADETINPRQLDILNILDPWRKVCAIYGNCYIYVKVYIKQQQERTMLQLCS